MILPQNPPQFLSSSARSLSLVILPLLLLPNAVLAARKGSLLPWIHGSQGGVSANGLWASLGGRVRARALSAKLSLQRYSTGSESDSPVRAAAVDDANPSAPAAQILWFWGSPEVLSHIGQGETVQWLWWDDKTHSVEGEGTASQSIFVGRGGGVDGVTEQGFVYNVTFDTPGEYSYHCHYYPNIMKGKIIVKPRMNIGGAVLPWYDGVSFGGASAIVEVGDTLTWQWSDDLPHSLMTYAGDTSVFSGPGTNGDAVSQYGFNYTKTFDRPGSFLYLCAQHGETMRGNITVVPKGSIS